MVTSVIVLSFLSMDIPNEIVIVLGSLKTTMLILLGVKQHYTTKDKISTTEKDKNVTE